DPLTFWAYAKRCVARRLVKFSCKLAKSKEYVRDRAKSRDPDELDTLGEPACHRTPDHTSDAATREAAEKLLATLPDDERYVVEQVIMRARRIKDVAEELEVPADTVARRRDRALEKLRKFQKWASDSAA